MYFVEKDHKIHFLQKHYYIWPKLIVFPIEGMMSMLCAPVRDDKIAQLKTESQVVAIFKGKKGSILFWRVSVYRRSAFMPYIPVFSSFLA